MTTLYDATSPDRSCVVCGQADCSPWKHVDSAFTDPNWSKRRAEAVGGPGAVLAPCRLFHAERLWYATGDVVPFADAVFFGLVEPASEATPGPASVEPPAPATSDETAKARGQARARRQTANRPTIAPEDRS